MRIFHTDFGANAIAPKLRYNGSADASGAMDGFFPVGPKGVPLDQCGQTQKNGWKSKTNREDL